MESGFWKLVLVALVALVVLGPERMPRVIRTVGLWVGRARRYFNDLTSELEKEIHAEDMGVDLKSFQREINENVMASEKQSTGASGDGPDQDGGNTQ